MIIPYNVKRSLTIFIPLVSALAFFGIIENISGFKLNDNLASTGITLSFIFGILNLLMLYWVFKHKVN